MWRPCAATSHYNAARQLFDVVRQRKTTRFWRRKRSEAYSTAILVAPSKLRMRRSGVNPPSRCLASVGNFARSLHTVIMANLNKTGVAGGGNSCHSPYRSLPSRKNYEGYIPRTCTKPIMHASPSPMPMIVRNPSLFSVSAQLASSNVPQRSEEWFALRKDKLTTSTFSTALGFWKGNRRSELWQQKVFAPEDDALEVAAKAAMDWGVFNESGAIERYKSITGRDVNFLGFAIHADAKFDWLGASPDGLLGCCPGGGILEVKCPYNKGKPELALPWHVVPHYYMPQVQGQMEVMDRNWVDLYCWTPNGSSLFRINRNREYWNLMHTILHEFWWQNVVPARELVLMEKEADARAFEPKPKHELTGLMIAKSLKLASEAILLCKDIGGHIEFFR